MHQACFSVKGLILGLLVLAGACGPLPLPDAVPLANANQAARAVLDRWHEDVALPPIYEVPADPACEVAVPGGTSIGFVNPQSGHCVGGFTDPGAGIFLLLHPRVGYSRHLAHELAHLIRRDNAHRLRGLWEPPLGESDTNLVPAANAWLSAQPELDVMEGAQ